MRSVLGIALLLVGFVACQGMYDKSPQRLTKVKPLPKPKGEGSGSGSGEAPPVVVYKEDCFTNFRGPTGGIPQAGEAGRLVKEGDEKLAALPKASSPDGKKDLILASIDKYRAALTKNPYDSEATLKLALAYHMTLRKGCALALLRRLETLSNDSRYREAAERQKGLVRDNEGYFNGYRKDALKEIP